MAIDSCEPQVIEALQKAGWTSLGQERLLLNGRTAIVDIKARRTANGSHQEILLIEVKCFTDAKKITSEIYCAFGQYIVYRGLQSALGIGTPLFLAIPERVHRTAFDTGIQRTVSDNHIKLLIVDIEKEEIVQWIR